MGSIVPFQDLNHPPPPPPQNPLHIFPKIEPKVEPLDEPPPGIPSIYTSNSIQNPTITDPDPLQLFPATDITSNASTNENDVYSEFYRISELFKTAFSKKGGAQQNYHENNNNYEVEEETLEDPNTTATPTTDCLSIVPVSHQEGGVVSTDVVTKRQLSFRSSEMVRVSTLGPEDQRYFRDLVRRSRMLFESLRILSIFEEDKGRNIGIVMKRLRGDLKAAALMRDKGLWLNRDKRIIGNIPGVCVGDIFFFRMEMCVLGLHGQVQAGIDYVPAVRSTSGEPVATSIIVSGGYEDDEDQGDVIIYTGQGGQLRNTTKQSVHQKLEGGNLALERSMFYGIEIRVIRGLKHEGSPTNKAYVYDGLYRVVDSWFDVGKSGFGVYKYKLVRMEDQHEMGSAIIRFAMEIRINALATRPKGYLSLDISNGKENIPVFLFNNIDADQTPLCYEYLPKSVYPPFTFQQMGNAGGCHCVHGCSEDCYCAQKNGGEFAYDRNGMLVRGKPLIYECGPFCSCPPTCRNRVSQKGLKRHLEIFRSRETGWGVRPLDLIPAGSFVCEYTGVVLTRQQAMVLSMNGDGLVYPSRFPERWSEWGDISQIFPDFIRPTYPSIPPLDFAMDVARMRNVACYISHSSSPNVLVQFVMYDHHNVLYPHLMIFAIENIPPLRELSLDYGVAEDWGVDKLAICN
ncbi:histone-lysine N-methyltransferase family member SUVH9-like [Papaver somniferum]|uniref:histone-lysine N-methyltransferase family member SUVH9-like n=1 Tax=Papaver somniferum TaxID=3469 RepID=UPI000E70316F|nr:histone-lysine N-methyltransferase family member SUVH9-like [Papaver somniferum]